MPTDTDRIYWRIWAADYIARNRDAVNARRRERYARCKDHILAQQRAYRAARAQQE